MYKILTILAVALLSLTISTVELASQVNVGGKFGKGIDFDAADSSFHVKFSTRFQTLYNGSYSIDNESWSESLMIRRSRLKFDGFVFDPRFEFKMEFGLSNRDTRGGRLSEAGNTASIILDAVLKYKFAKGWALWFGQTKLPGNRERVVSSQKLQFVDRSLVNSRFNIDRDLGVQLRNKSSIGDFGINTYLAYSLGEGRDIIANNFDNGREITARVEFLPFGSFTSKGDYFGSDLKREKDPKLSIGITYDMNMNTNRSRGNLGSFVTDNNGDYLSSDLNTIFIDYMFKWRGFSSTAEFAYKDADEYVAGFGYGQGLAVTMAYLFKSNYEIALRYTTIDPISDFTSINEEEEYTLGFSRYIVGHSLKLQSDLSYMIVGQNTERFRFRFQTEVAL